jgi:hypothetical protein
MWPVQPCPSVIQESPWTRFATLAARVVVDHAQNAPEDSVESGRAARVSRVPLACAARMNGQITKSLGRACEIVAN